MSINRQYSPNTSHHPKDEEAFDYNDSFFNQNVQLSDYLFLPEGLEWVMLLLYFVTIPYGIGLIVIWLFIAGGNMDSFLILDIFTIIPVWSIGYETIGGLIMLNIIISAIRFYAGKKAYLAKQHETLEKQKRRNPSKFDVSKNYKQHR